MKKFLMVATGLLLAVAFTEIIFRVSHNRSGNRSENSQEAAQFPVVQHNGFLGYAPVPNESGRGYHINAQGFRADEDCAFPKPSDEFRVFITGGSAAWGAGVQQSNHFASVLSQFLLAQGKKVKVYVVACGGWVSTQERIATHNTLLLLQPDVVVAFGGWNDAYFSYWGFPVMVDHDFMNLKKRLDDSTNFRKVIVGMQFIPTWEDYACKTWFKIMVEPTWRPQSIKLKRTMPGTAGISWLFNMDLMSKPLRGQGCVFVAVLQPCLSLSKKVRTDQEERALAQHQAEFPPFGDYLATVYNTAMVNASIAQVPVAYGEQAIANAKDTVFFDYIHMNKEGHRLMGMWLSVVLTEQFRIQKGGK